MRNLCNVMVDYVQGDVLLPSLLDRLTDDERGQEVESRRSRSDSIASLKVAVLRDLEHLLNTTNLELSVDLDRFPEVQKSVLNYGLPNLSGSTVSSIGIPTIEKSIREAIKRFEPRLLEDSVRVTALNEDGGKHNNSVVFQVEATLWGNPMPEVLFLRTELDLEIGEVSLKESED